jgi:hypothetical protein
MRAHYDPTKVAMLALALVVTVISMAVWLVSHDGQLIPHHHHHNKPAVGHKATPHHAHKSQHKAAAKRSGTTHPTIRVQPVAPRPRRTTTTTTTTTTTPPRPKPQAPPAHHREPQAPHHRTPAPTAAPPAPTPAAAVRVGPVEAHVDCPKVVAAVTAVC